MFPLISIHWNLFITESIGKKIFFLFCDRKQSLEANFKEHTGSLTCFIPLTTNQIYITWMSSSFQSVNFRGFRKMLCAFRNVLTFEFPWLAAQKHRLHEPFSQDLKSYQTVEVHGHLQWPWNESSMCQFGCLLHRKIDAIKVLILRCLSLFCFFRTETGRKSNFALLDHKCGCSSIYLYIVWQA